MEKIIYHDECACLFANNVRDKECLNRYYKLYDVESNSFLTVVICNELIRLLVSKGLNKSKDYYFSSAKDRVQLVECILKDIFKKYIKLDSDDHYTYSNDLFDSRISIIISQRPYIYRYLNFKHAIQLYLNNNNNLIREDIINTIHYYMDKMQYKKYKTRYKDVKILTNKIKYTYGEDKKILINELFTKLLELQIKEKL